MQAQAMQRMIAVAIFWIATDRMAHVCGVYANLILASCLQLEFHSRVLSRTIHYMPMCDGKLPSVING